MSSGGTTGEAAVLPAVAAWGNAFMESDRQRELRELLVQLREEHRAIDAEISAMAETANADQLTIQRLKRRKLRLKDQIAAVEDQLLPDIIA